MYREESVDLKRLYYRVKRSKLILILEKHSRMRTGTETRTRTVRIF